MEGKLKDKASKIALDWLVSVVDRALFSEFVELFRVVRAAVVAEQSGEVADAAFANRAGYSGTFPWTGLADGIESLEAMVSWMTSKAGGYDTLLVDTRSKLVYPIIGAPADVTGMVLVSIRKTLIGRIDGRRRILN